MEKISSKMFCVLLLIFFLFTSGFKTAKNDSGLDALKNVVNIIKNEYVEITKEEDLIYASIRGMLLNIDPYSAYLTNKELNDIKIQSKGEFEGIGIEITIEDGMVKVISPIDGTPAYLAGIKPGDIIASIDGKLLKGINLSDVADLMRGKAGTAVKLSVIRDFTVFDLEILRANINVNSIFVKEEKNVVYIRISSFTEFSEANLKKEMRKVLKKINGNLIGIILDLRNNPGGLLEQAINIADLFLPDGKIIVSTINKNKDEVKNFYSSNVAKLNITSPIVVIINEGSASASEILAGTLRDNERAIIIGKKSFGKASVQSIIPLENKLGAVKLTTSYYYTPSGKSIQGSGIIPDIEVNQKYSEINNKVLDSYNNKTSLFIDQDQQLEKAFDMLYSFSVFDNIKNNRK